MHDVKYRRTRKDLCWAIIVFGLLVAFWTAVFFFLGYVIAAMWETVSLKQVLVAAVLVLLVVAVVVSILDDGGPGSDRTA